MTKYVKAVRCASGAVVEFNEAKELGVVGSLISVTEDQLTKELILERFDTEEDGCFSEDNNSAFEMVNLSEIGFTFNEDGGDREIIDSLRSRILNDKIETRRARKEDESRINEKLENLKKVDEETILKEMWSSLAEVDYITTWRRLLMVVPFNPLKTCMKVHGVTLETWLKDEYKNRKPNGKGGNLYGPTLKVVIDFFRTMQGDPCFRRMQLMRQYALDVWKDEIHFNDHQGRKLERLAEHVEEGQFRFLISNTKEYWGENKIRINEAGDKVKAKELLSELSNISTKVRNNEVLNKRDHAFIGMLWYAAESRNQKFSTQKERTFGCTIPLWQIFFCVHKITQLFWSTSAGIKANSLQIERSAITDYIKMVCKDNNMPIENLWARFNRENMEVKANGITCYWTNGDTESVDEQTEFFDPMSTINCLADNHVKINEGERFEINAWEYTASLIQEKRDVENKEKIEDLEKLVDVQAQFLEPEDEDIASMMASIR